MASRFARSADQFGINESMDFNPINGEHSILSAGFVVVLASPIPDPAIHGLRYNKVLLADLPAVQLPEFVEMAVGPMGQQVNTRVTTGVQLAHVRPDGTPAWALRAGGSEIVVECRRFTRWGKVWSTARTYLEAALRETAAANEGALVVKLGHAMADVFVTRSDEYELGTLLRHSALISEKIFSSGPTWHSHVGWFDYRTALEQAQTPVLNQQH